MTAQDRIGRPDNPTRPRRRPSLGVVLLTGLVVAGPPAVAASWPASGTTVSQASAAPTSPTDQAWGGPTSSPGSEPGTVTFRVVPATPTAPPTPPTRPPTPWPTPSGGQLPVTGSGPVPGWLPTVGALLVLGGGLILVIARRSRRTSPDPTGRR